MGKTLSLITTQKYSIAVGSEYECKNGFLGLNRYVVLKMMRFIWKVEKIRIIMGIDQKVYSWKEANVWNWAISDKEIPIQFMPNLAAQNVLNTGSKLMWNEYGQGEMFIADLEITEGTIRITVEYDGYSGDVDSGFIQKERYDKLLTSQYLGIPTFLEGSCTLNYSGLACHGNKVTRSRIPFFSDRNKVTVAFVLDTDRHILLFFVNGVQIPHRVTNVPSRVGFAVSNSEEGTSVELKSLQRLKVFSEKLACECHSWNDRGPAKIPNPPPGVLDADAQPELQFQPNPNADNVSNTGAALHWDSIGEGEVFFANKVIVRGIYKITIKCTGMIGYVDSGFVENSFLDEDHFTITCKGTAILQKDGVYCGGLKVSGEGRLFSETVEVVLSFELDADRHVLLFSVNGVQIPHTVCGVPPSVRFAVVNYYKGVSIELVSVENLSVSSGDPALKCEVHPWR